MSSGLGEINSGDRLQVGEHRCTVRYIGSLEGQEGQWVGVEWDVPEQGNNNGQIDGHRYFETEDGGDSGSFLPLDTIDPEKSLLPLDTIDPGKSLVAALIERYKERGMGPGYFDEEDMTVMATRNKTKKVELVGKCAVDLRQSKTHLLVTAELSEESISTLGDAGELEEMVPNLEELNLSGNLLTSWLDIAKIPQLVPSLRILNISRNRFSVPKAVDCPTVTGLRCLILNNCKMRFTQALIIASRLPHLRQLQLLGNSIRHLSPKGDSSISIEALEHIQVLDLENNEISTWEEAEKLSKLPNLSRLNLSRNPIDAVNYPSQITDSSPLHFPSLENLSLSRCQIEEVKSVDALHRFPKLREIRLLHNPVTEKKCPRYEVTARIGKLTFYNGSTVSARERVDCERRYLSLIAGELLDISEDSKKAAVLEPHPRYGELVETHGEIVAASQSSGGPQTLGDSTVELKLTCVATTGKNKMGTETKRLPLTMNIGILKSLVATVFVLNQEQIKLFLRDKTMPVPEPMEDDDRLQLKYLDLKDGQEVLVDVA